MNRRTFLSYLGLSIFTFLNGCFKRNTLVCFVGDSITAGTGTTRGCCYPNQVIKLIPFIDGITLGYPGQTAFDFNHINKIEALKTIRKSYRPKIAVIFFGANDIEQYSVDKTYQEIKKLHQTFNANGFKTITVPIMNRKDVFIHQPAFDQNRLKLNNRLRTNFHSFSDGFVDFSNIPLLYSSDAPDNSNLFDTNYPSRVHLNNAGAAILANAVAAQIRSLIQNKSYG